MELFSVDVFDQAKEKVLTTQWSLFVVGAGGFGGKRASDQIIPTVDPPKRQPDASLQYKTSSDQVNIDYRVHFIFITTCYFINSLF